MSTDHKVNDRLTILEKNIANCQKDIDRVRALFPREQRIQLILDRQQSTLDEQKRVARNLKALDAERYNKI